MEENKAKTIKMGNDNKMSNTAKMGKGGAKVSVGANSNGQQKLTYEQLNDACNQLWQQNKQLVRRNQELEQYAVNKRLDYLFKVLEFSDKFYSDFITDCASEIEAALTIPVQLEDSDSKDKEKESSRENPKDGVEKETEGRTNDMKSEGEDLVGKGL